MHARLNTTSSTGGGFGLVHQIQRESVAHVSLGTDIKRLTHQQKWLITQACSAAWLLKCSLALAQPILWSWLWQRSRSRSRLYSLCLILILILFLILILILILILGFASEEFRYSTFPVNTDPECANNKMSGSSKSASSQNFNFAWPLLLKKQKSSTSRQSSNQRTSRNVINRKLPVLEERRFFGYHWQIPYEQILSGRVKYRLRFCFLDILQKNGFSQIFCEITKLWNIENC